MPTVAVGTLEVGAFPLAESLEREPAVEFECERVAPTGRSAAALVWAYAPGEVTVDDLLAADPSVDDWTLAASLEEASLYRLELVRDLAFLRQVTGEARASVLDGYGTSRGWRLCLAFPGPEALAATRSFCEHRGLGFDVREVRSVPEGPLDRHGLSERQHEALTVAWRLGYFDVPRGVDLGDVADELGISHQAASERLRRGSEALVRELLGAGARARLPGL
jgi:hypothetical protein